MLDTLSGKLLVLSFRDGDCSSFVEKHIATDTNSAVILSLDRAGEIDKCKQGEFDAVVGFTDRAYRDRYLELILKVLKPGAKLVLRVPKDTNATQVLLFGGFTDVSDVDSDDGHKYTVGQKPPWEEGAAATLSFLKKPAAQPAPIAGGDVWNLAEDDLADDDVELADEDDLLANEVDAVDIASVKEAACGVPKDGEKPKRKACKDCSCGLKEWEEENDSKEAKERAVSAPPVSACGSCGLGDAFRCSTCPFLGKPAFKQDTGNAVKLSL